MEVIAYIVPDLLDYLTFGVTALTLVLLAYALYYARRQLKSMEKARHCQALLHFLQTWNSDEMVDSRRLIDDYDENTLPEAIEKAAKLNSLNYFRLTRVADFFEDLGYAALKAKYVELFDALRELSPATEKYYRLYQKYITHSRQREKEGKQETGVEPVYENFCDLAAEIKKRKEAKT